MSSCRKWSFHSRYYKAILTHSKWRRKKCELLCGYYIDSYYREVSGCKAWMSKFWWKFINSLGALSSSYKQAGLLCAHVVSWPRWRNTLCVYSKIAGSCNTSWPADPHRMAAIWSHHCLMYGMPCAAVTFPSLSLSAFLKMLLPLIGSQRGNWVFDPYMAGDALILNFWGIYIAVHTFGKCSVDVCCIILEPQLSVLWIACYLNECRAVCITPLKLCGSCMYHLL
jgi:hypothetical protein